MENFTIEGFFEFETQKKLCIDSKKIAIVGNGGCILNKKNGSLIDSHDIIIRFNHANTKDFTEYTGNKTTDLVINCHIYKDLDLKKAGFESWKSTKNIFNQYHNCRILYVNTNIPSKGRGSVPSKLPFYIMQKSYFDSCQFNPYKISKIPTVGFATICSFIRSGFQPNLFGFTTDARSEWDHYFEKRPKASVSHSHNEEINCLLDLEKKGFIQVF